MSCAVLPNTWVWLPGTVCTPGIKTGGHFWNTNEIHQLSKTLFDMTFTITAFSTEIIKQFCLWQHSHCTTAETTILLQTLVQASHLHVIFLTDDLSAVPRLAHLTGEQERVRGLLTVDVLIHKPHQQLELRVCLQSCHTATWYACHVLKVSCHGMMWHDLKGGLIYSHYCPYCRPKCVTTVSTPRM